MSLLSDQDDFDEVPERSHVKAADDANDPFLKPGRYIHSLIFGKVHHGAQNFCMPELSEIRIIDSR